MKSYLRALWMPLCVVVLNVIVFSLWNSPTILMDLIRIGAAFWGGWSIIKHNAGNLLSAALAGPLLLFVDHVLLRGGYFLLCHLFNPAKFEYQGLMAFGGVIVSYVMFFWIPLLIAYLGGLVARHS